MIQPNRKISKIMLNKKAREPGATLEDKAKAKQAIRMYSHVLKVQKEREKTRTAKNEEKMYRSNFWKTAKDVTNGTFGKSEYRPTFTKCTEDKYYKEKYEQVAEINIENLDWFPSINEPTVEYNLSPYTPKDLKNIIYNMT